MSIAKDKMLSYLPPYYGKSRVMQSILQSQGEEIDQINDALEDIFKQFFIATATWGLSFYEEKYGLPTNEDLDYETRRKLILIKKIKGSNKVVQMMKIFEQTISLAWGRLILPFTLHSEVDTYNFGHLVNVLERYKPAHLGYGFRIIMQDLQSGYSIYAGHKYRDKVNFSLISGTSKAGRWPWWSSIGQSKNSIIQIRTDIATGISVFQYIGVSTGDRLTTNIGILAEKKTGVSLYSYSGEKIANGIGITNNLNLASNLNLSAGSSIYSYSGVSIGNILYDGLNCTSKFLVGNVLYPSCGSYLCGEEVA